MRVVLTSRSLRWRLLRPAGVRFFHRRLGLPFKDPVKSTRIKLARRHVRSDAVCLRRDGWLPSNARVFVRRSEKALLLVCEVLSGKRLPADGHRGGDHSHPQACGKRGRSPGYFRSDSAAHQSDVVDLLDGERVGYTITADSGEAAEESPQAIPEGSWEVLLGRDGFNTWWKISGTVHTMNDSDASAEGASPWREGDEKRPSANAQSPDYHRSAPRCERSGT